MITVDAFIVYLRIVSVVNKLVETVHGIKRPATQQNGHYNHYPDT